MTERQEVHANGPDPDEERQIRKLLDGFSQNPTDTRAFATLEEHLFLAGAWSQLAGVYESRLAALESNGGDRTDLLLRLGTLLEERLDSQKAAKNRYQELLQLQPDNAQGLARLRRAHVALGELAAALQVAEAEEAIEQPREARARTLGEVGELWRAFGEREEAENRYSEAIRLDPKCDPALAGLAALAREDGDRDSAAAFLERRLSGLSGPARLDAMEEMASLLPHEDQRVRRLLHEVVAARPERRPAVERLIELEQMAEAWEKADELRTHLFEHTREPEAQIQLALEGAAAHLAAGHTDEVGSWLARACDLGADTPQLHKLQGRLARKTAKPGALIDALEALNRLEGPDVMRELEIAVLHEREGRPQRAVEFLRSMLERDPEDAEALAILDRCLARLSHHSERVEVLEKRLELAEESDEYANLATALGDVFREHLDDPASAEEQYRRALARVTEHDTARERLKELYYKYERYDELDVFLEGAALHASTAEARAQEWCELAQLRFNLCNEPEKARAAYVRALESDPTSEAALDGLRRLGTSGCDDTALLIACEHELELGPDADRARELLREVAEASSRSGDLARAHEAALRWADLDGSAQALTMLVQLSRERGDRSAERAALESLVGVLDELPEERAEALVRLGDMALEECDSLGLEPAGEWYAQALALGPQPEVRPRLIDIYQRTGQLSELTALLREELDNASGEAALALRVRLARTLAELGELEPAIAELRPAFDAHPTDAGVADLFEGLLAESNDLPELVAVLEQRLGREHEPGRRREVAHRLGGLLLDGLGRADDAVAALREMADPSRHAPLESLFERALEATEGCREHETWLVMREGYVDGQAKIRLFLRLARLQRELERDEEAIATLRRAERQVAPEQLHQIWRPLLELVRETDDLQAQLRVLGQLVAASEEEAPRARFGLQRAQLLIEKLDRPAEGVVELEALEDLTLLSVQELRTLKSLCERADDPAGRVRALEALASAHKDEDEEARTLRELSELLSNGPEGVRDDVRAEEILRELLERDPASGTAHEHLAVLLERTGQPNALADLLEARLEIEGLPDAERAALALRLANVLTDAGDLRTAAEVLRGARAGGPTFEAVDELLFRIYEIADDTAGKVELASERARAGGEAHKLWLRRWLDALALREAPDEESLAVLDELLAESPHQAELLALRLPYLRRLGRHNPLADTIEGLLGRAHRLAAGQRRVLVRELLRLYEGALRSPRKALARIEQEVEKDPALRERGVRLAAQLGDDEREAALLKPLVMGLPSGRAPDPRRGRRLGLLLARLERDGQAEPLLRRALEQSERDAEVMVCLEDIVRRRGDGDELASLLDAHFDLVSAGERAVVAKEALLLSERAGDRPAALRWLRRWNAVEGISHRRLMRWAELEREVGDRRGLFRALNSLRENAEDDEALATATAEMAALQLETGQSELARESYEDALRLMRDPPVQWLGALDQILGTQGSTVRRSGLLRDLTRHGDLSEAERARYREVRFELLISEPELHEEATAELRKLLDARAPREVQVSRMRALLRLYDELDHTAEWCDLAERLVEELEGEEKYALERTLAQHLTRHFFDRERATDRWRAIVAREPRDLGALAALADLLAQPGCEAERASVLQRLALREEPPNPARWVLAAQLYWDALRDAAAALPCIDAALALEPENVRGHALRAQVCAHLGRAADETASLEILVRIDPDGRDVPERWLRLAELKPEEEGDVAAEACEAAERALALSEEPGAMRPRVRAVFERVGAFDRASDLLRSEIEQSPARERAPLLRRLAEIEWEERHRAPETCAALDELAPLGLLGADDYERWAEALAREERWSDVVEKRAAALECHGEAAGADEWLDLGRLALDKADDAECALAACDHALARDPNLLAALELRADLCGRAGDRTTQLEDLVTLGERREDAAVAARDLCRAASLAGEELGDSDRAGALYRAALKRDPSSTEALLGAGEIAYGRREWSEAERMFGSACALLRQDSDNEKVGAVARRAADAALEQHRDAEAFSFLEQSLEVAPRNPNALDSMAQLALRLGAHDRARSCLEARLSHGDLTPEEHADRLVRLAQACEGDDAFEAAAAALEEAIALRPSDEVSRARVVDLLERLGQTDRAVRQLDSWFQHSPADTRPALALRAARIQREAGHADDARRRLEVLLESDAVPSEAWVELARLSFADEGRGAEGALAIAERGLAQSVDGQHRGPLLWLAAEALVALDRVGDAAQRALETLQVDAANIDAAQLLAQNLGHVNNWRGAVSQLERSLDVAHPSAPVESELWEAIGRAYAGPLESIERAERCYRRSLEANPLRASAREALADITAFDPAAHRESVHLHGELLEAFPARPGSWRSLARVADHWKRDRARATCDLVLYTLRCGTSATPPSGSRPLIHTGSSGNAAVRAATELLRALNEANRLPNVTPMPSDLPELPIPLRVQLAEMAGPGWDLANDVLFGIWNEPVPEALQNGEGLSRRSRRQLQRALKEPQGTTLQELEVDVFREELLAQASARCVDQGTLTLEEALYALLELWPATAQLDLRSGGNLPAATQLCPPAQALLLRVADTTLGALGL